MQTTFALAALFGAVMAAPQASSSAAASGAPLAAAPAGCDRSYSGDFEITIVKPSGLKKRQDASTCGKPGYLTLNLQNGNLMDTDGRTGYIASANSQFQFDKPVQAGGEYAGQFSVCKNGSIALGPTTTFYQCQSGSFYNLYYTADAEQCSPVNIDIIPCDSSSSSASMAPSTMVSAAAATSAKPVSVSSDGQPQGTAKATSVVPVSVFSDGQPQATARATSVKPAVVSEFTDGQPQATAAATAKSNVTAAAPKPTATIATAGGATIAASFSMAGLMAVFALIF